MRRWWQVLLPLGASAIGSMAELLRRAGDAQQRAQATPQQEHGRSEHYGSRGGLRALAVDFLSDVLAETYRKLREPRDYRRRKP